MSAGTLPSRDGRNDAPPPSRDGGEFSSLAVRDRLRKPTPWHRKLKERIIEKALLACGMVSIFAIVLIFAFLFKEGFAALQLVDKPSEFLYSTTAIYEYDAALDETVNTGEQTTLTWQPVSEQPKLSLVPLLWGSMGVALLTALLSTFAGIAVGIYLSEIATHRIRGYVKPALELLVGIPTVVIGFFMLTVIAIPIKNLLNPDGNGPVTFYHDLYNMFIGALGVSIVIIPVIASLVDDALRAVPMDLRAASMSLGSTRWQTTYRVVVPSGISGVIAAVVLGFGRALGETMIVLMCAGNAPQLVANPFESVRTMTASIAAEMGAAQHGSLHYHSLFFVGAVLITLAFILNVIVEVIANHYRKKIRL